MRMYKVVVLTVALLLSALATQAQLISPMHNKGASAGVTWTVVQHPSCTTATTSGSSGNRSCTVTNTQNTTAGNLLILLSSAFGNFGQPTQVSASGDGTWTHCPNSSAAENYSSTNWMASDCYYILSATGGAASETFTWNYSGGNHQAIDVEVHRSTGTAVYDTGNTATNASCSSCVAPTLTLSGSSDYIVQWIAFASTVRSISGPYSNPLDLENANVEGGFAGALNQSSGAGPTWTTTPADGAAMSGVAFR